MSRGAVKLWVVILTVVTLVVALIGYDLIHRAEQWLTYLMIVIFGIFTISLFFIHYPAGTFDVGTFKASPFLGQFGVVAGYQISWAIYVSDYSRYLPPDVTVRKTFYWTYWGSAIGGAWMMIVGSVLAAWAGPGFSGTGIDSFRKVRPTIGLRVVTVGFTALLSLVGALAATKNFLGNFNNFLLLILYLFIPWTAVNLVDYYIVRRGHYAIAEIFNPRGMYGRWGWRGILAYLIGFAAMSPFFDVGTLHEGAAATALGGADISFFVGCRSPGSCTTCSPARSTWRPRRGWPRPRWRNSRRPREGTNDRYACRVSSPSVPMTVLGRSGLQVSRLALGSWRSYERIGRDQGVRVMQAAREAGINFLDDARYNDETGHAPMPTGYSEVVFGELFRTAGWRRDEAIVSNKLWWEFWPDQSPAQELAASLARMRLDHIDLIYSDALPAGVGLEDAIEMITGLIAAGAARAWGTFNWTPDQMERAWQIADREGAPGPTATQPAYSLVRREIVDDPAMRRLAADRGVAIVASYTLAGGILTGKYDEDPGAGRAAGMLDQPQWASAVAAGRELAALARDIGADPASLAMAFALLDPSVTTVLFGATRPEQVNANLGALALADRLTPEERDRLAAIGVRRLAGWPGGP